MSPETPATGTRRLEITPGALVMLVAAIAGAMLARSFFAAGRTPLGWVLASVVCAAAISPAVSLLERRIKRGFALILVLIPLLIGVGLVVGAVYRDLDHSVDQLKEAIPEAAASIEENDRFGEVARSMDLGERAKKVADGLEKPSSKVADRALDRGSAYLVVSILTIFMLIWGPKFSEAGLGQITDEERREKTRRLVGTAFRRSRTYIDVSLLQGLLVGFVAWGAFTLLDLPAPTPLALVVAVFSLIPVVGILVGSLPAVLLLAGLDDPVKAGLLLLAVLVIQIGQVLAFRRLTQLSLYVGPAIIAIAALIGFDMYGLGGVVFLSALVVFGVALVDTRAEAEGGAMRPVDALPTEVHEVPADTPDGESDSEDRPVR